MIYYIYNLWTFYNYLVAFHGIYVAYSILFWSYQNMCFFCSYIFPHNPNKILQIKDK